MEGIMGTRPTTDGWQIRESTDGHTKGEPGHRGGERQGSLRHSCRHIEYEHGEYQFPVGIITMTKDVTEARL